MTFRVTYPLISTDGHRDFPTEAEANAFAQHLRNLPYYEHLWRRIRVTPIGRCATCGE